MREIKLENINKINNLSIFNKENANQEFFFLAVYFSIYDCSSYCLIFLMPKVYSRYLSLRSLRLTNE